MDPLKKIIFGSLQTYLVLMGAVTGLGGVGLLLAPEGAGSALLLIPLTGEIFPLVQHWGVLLALVGGFMVLAAFKPDWRVPAMAISGIEKAFVACFGWVVYPGAFVADAGLYLDTFGAVYSLLYFIVLWMTKGHR